MRKIAVANQKGGSGKTTTTVNLAAALAERGKKILIVDCDQQASASMWLGEYTKGQSLYHVMIEDLPLTEAIRPVEVSSGVDLVPGSNMLVERSLAQEIGIEQTLKNKISEIDGYDFALLDCSPSLGLLTVGALIAADEVLIPVEASVLALQGLAELTSTIQKIKERIHPTLKIAGILVCRVDSRTVNDRQALQSVQDHFSSLALNTIIRENVRIREAPSYGEPITIYAPDSHGAQDYRALAEELLNQGERNG